VSEFGTVKFVSDRGFLFLIPDHGGKDIFGHISDFERAGLRVPLQGERYEYEMEMTPKGPKAVNLVPA
jgi:cold shock protein